MDGLSFSLVFGKYTGFHAGRTDYSWYLKLGWVSFAIIFCNLEKAYNELKEEAEMTQIANKVLEFGNMLREAMITRLQSELPKKKEKKATKKITKRTSKKSK